MPALFIGHGSPLNLVLDNSFTRSLSALGKRLPRPKAVMVISAHWLTNGTRVTCMAKPKTIYDFYGFPEELYNMSYPSPGSPEEAKRAIEIVKKADIRCGPGWGLDHASWSVLKHLYPDADVPVFEMSLDYSFNEWHPKPLQYHYDIGAELAELRNRGVLIIGSGNIVHNLALIDFHDIEEKPFEWAREFDEAVKANLLGRNHKDLVRYENMGKTSHLAVPTLDHYLPMIYVIALQENGEPVSFIHEGFQYSAISMRCFQIG